MFYDDGAFSCLLADVEGRENTSESGIVFRFTERTVIPHAISPLQIEFDLYRQPLLDLAPRRTCDAEEKTGFQGTPEPLGS